MGHFFFLFISIILFSGSTSYQVATNPADALTYLLPRVAVVLIIFDLACFRCGEWPHWWKFNRYFKNMRKLNKNESVGIAIVIVLVIVAFFFYQYFINLFNPSSGTTTPVDTTNIMPNPQDQNSTTTTSQPSTPVTATTNNQSVSTTLADGLIIQDEVVGSGDTAQTGDTVTVKLYRHFHKWNQI